MNRFAKFSWLLLGWTILVIAWGTVVRATNSGAGCGSFWPLCGQSLIPSFEIFHTVIEFSHRIMSGLLIVFVITLVVWGTKNYRSDPTRRRMVWTIFALTILESILGAGLVLLKLVEDNSSTLRIFAVSIHLLNTFLLLGAVSVNAWWSNHPTLSKAGFDSAKKLISGFLLLILTIGITGAITALADTLFPSTSIAHTLSEQFKPTTHILITLRAVHPIIALIFGFAIIKLIQIFIVDSTSNIKMLKTAMIALIIFQIFLGFLNIMLLTPLVIQVLHLVTADLMWVFTILLFLNEPDIKHN